jgi:hypothetical protein
MNIVFQAFTVHLVLPIAPLQAAFGSTLPWRLDEYSEKLTWKDFASCQKNNVI